MFDLRAASPHRPVNWRWERAQELRTAGRLCKRGRDDEWVAAARDFQNDLARVRGEDDLYDLLELWPALTEAHRLHTHESRYLRAALEARLLCGTSHTHLAGRMQLHPDVVDWYELLFFQVDDRLLNVDWITSHAIGRNLHDSLNRRDFELVWKLFAYGGGEHVLDAVISNWVQPQKAASPAQVEKFLLNQGRGNVLRSACLQSLSIPCTDAYQQIGLLTLQREYHQLEAQARSGLGDDALRSNLEAALRTMPWIKKIQTPDQAAAETASEPRAVEVVLRAYGHDGPSGLGTENMPPPRFPPRRLETAPTTGATTGAATGASVDDLLRPRRPTAATVASRPLGKRRAIG